MEEKSSRSRIQSFSNNGLVVVIASGLIVTFLTNRYALRLKDVDYDRASKMAREQSLSEELNKIRMHKIGEVWEQIDENEVALDNLFNQVTTAPGPNKTRFTQTNQVITKDIVVINRNRFWLGEAAYDQLLTYLKISSEILQVSFLGKPGMDLSKIREKREAAKQDINKMRNMFSNAESPSVLGKSP